MARIFNNILSLPPVNTRNLIKDIRSYFIKCVRSVIPRRISVHSRCLTVAIAKRRHLSK